MGFREVLPPFCRHIIDRAIQDKSLYNTTLYIIYRYNNKIEIVSLKLLTYLKH